MVFPYSLTSARDAGSHGRIIGTSIAYYQYLQGSGMLEAMAAPPAGYYGKSYMRYHT
jgi:hypothetical protein